MNVALLLKTARHKAGVTQRQLAERAETTQPAVAAYESGARIPTLATMERLLAACEHDLELHVSPRV